MSGQNPPVIKWSGADAVWGLMLAIGLLYEAYALAAGKELLSQSFWKNTRRSAIVPGGLMFLCGHLVWQQSTYVNELHEEKDALKAVVIAQEDGV